MKKVIVATMRRAEPTPEARDATVPLFVDLNEFCAALGVTDRSQIHTFAVEPDGLLSAHRSGPYDDAAGAAIEACVRVPV